ncbi:MAG: alkaline shock response membrane anchor protein AmaP [Anaerolineae bacterium]|jgi:hypothetical protein
MNTFNRVVLVVLLLAVMGVCSLILILPLRTLWTVAQQANALARWLELVRPVVRLPAGILLALIVDLVGILFIVLEVRRPPAKSINVEQASGGEVTLSVASIADQLQVGLSQLPGIMQVKPKVSAKRKGVMVELDARISADAGVPDMAEKMVEKIQHVIEEKMGLNLARPAKVNIEAVRDKAGQRPPAEAPAPVAVASSEPQDKTEGESELP